MHDTTTIGGFTIPSSDPLFLGIVAIHVLLGIAAVVTGLIAMLSVKKPKKSKASRRGFGVHRIKVMTPIASHVTFI